jgi:FkbM family methyltransferase
MHFEDGVSVGFRSLDSMIEAMPADARVLMKIDVEGTEDRIFRDGQVSSNVSVPTCCARCCTASRTRGSPGLA